MVLPLISMSVAAPLLWMPPPWSSAVLPAIVLSVIVGTDVVAET